MCKKAPFGNKFIDECVSKRRRYQNSEQIGGILFLYFYTVSCFRSINQLTDLPDSLSSLKALREINISNNR